LGNPKNDFWKSFFGFLFVWKCLENVANRKQFLFTKENDVIYPENNFRNIFFGSHFPEMGYTDKEMKPWLQWPEWTTGRVSSHPVVVVGVGVTPRLSRLTLITNP